MKCIRCLAKLKNEDVYFNTVDSIVSSESHFKNENGISEELMSDAAQQFEAEVNDSENSNSQIREDTGRFKLSDCELKFSNFTPVFSSPKSYSTPKDMVEDENGALVQIQYVDKNNNVRITQTRYCPNCGSPLPPQSGTMPTYVTLFFGGSSSGKTVYIATVNYLFRNTIFLPGNGFIQALPAGNRNDSFKSITDELFNNGILPGTTAKALPDPLTLQINYIKNGNIDNQCLFSLVDMRGEDMVINGMLLFRNNLITKADSFLLAIDPMSIENVIVDIGNDIGENERGGSTDKGIVNVKMLRQIAEEILPSMPGGIINAPSIVMMMKMDQLINHIDHLNLLEKFHLTVNSNVRSTYDRKYFNNMGRSSSDLFRRADETLYNGIKGCFKNPYFTTVTSLGCHVKISKMNNDDGQLYIKEPQFIKPIRVLDPIVILLLKYGFLPLIELDTIQQSLGQIIIR